MRRETNTIVFSKNRACQLDLFLRSIDFPVSVLYKADKEFKLGYDKLIKMYPWITFIEEVNFKEQLVGLINNGGDYVMLSVDDDIMLLPFEEDSYEFNEFKRNEDILCLSLRLSDKYIYKGNPEIKNRMWEWKKYHKNSEHRVLRNWGYPMAVAGHIFKKNDILPIIISNDIKTPNFLEGVLNKNIPNRPLMICFEKAMVINNMANQVQSDYPCTNANVSLSELEEGFLSGKRLSLEDMREKGNMSRGCFIVEKYEWDK